jgi:hypothetical protein
MGRKYDITWFASITAAAAQDLIQLTAAATKVVKILAVHVEQSSKYGDANAQGLRLQVIRGTAGGGGTLITTNAAPVSPSDTAFAGTVRGGQTGALLTALTPIAAPFVLAEGGMNNQAGWHWTPPENKAWEVAPSAIVALRTQTAPAATTDFEITIEVEELG